MVLAVFISSGTLFQIIGAAQRDQVTVLLRETHNRFKFEQLSTHAGL